jgi:binding-protein-dependent transport system inner membrane component
VPVGILSGIYVSEYRRSVLASAVRFSADVLNGVPSIVIGIFAYSLAVLPFKRFSAFAGSLALGIMMIPIIIRTTEELLALVPPTLREGSMALGATRAGNPHRGPGGTREDCRGDRAAVVHLVRQPLLVHPAGSADGLPDGPGLHLRHFPLR